MQYKYKNSTGELPAAVTHVLIETQIHLPVCGSRWAGLSNGDPKLWVEPMKQYEILQAPINVKRSFRKSLKIEITVKEASEKIQFFQYKSQIFQTFFLYF